MVAYYVFQSAILAMGLVLCAIRIPNWFRLSVLPRTLLAASMTPQVIGLLVMSLAQMDVQQPLVYAHAPFFMGCVLIFMSGNRAFSHALKSIAILKNRISGVLVISVLAFVLFHLIRILFGNANILNPLPHDFNVYLAAAKKFSLNPGSGSIPSFLGGLGDLITVHPHSFIYEAYLSHSLLLGGPDEFFPSLDFMPRLAQQMTVLYFLVAIAGMAAAVGARWAAAAAVLLVLCVPWVDYIAGSLSRDGFRLIPILGFVLLLSTLGLNFSSSLKRRALLAGGYGAAAVMSHTLSVVLIPVMGMLLIVKSVIKAKPATHALAAYLSVLSLVGSMSIVRYIQNYIQTGHSMGYGLAFSVYKGTWLESLLGSRWTDVDQSWWSIFVALLDRYGLAIQFSAIIVVVLSLSVRGRGRIGYQGVVIAFWGALFISMSGWLDYSGINLRNALVNNSRYGLPFFVPSAVLLAAGISRMSGRLVDFFSLGNGWRTLGCFLSIILISYFSMYSISMSSWVSARPNSKDIEQIRFIDRGVRCLGEGNNWFVDDDRWDIYYIKHPPVFSMTMPARPLLEASNREAIASLLDSMKIKMVAFIYNENIWINSALHEFVEEKWIRIPLIGGSYERTIWVAPDVYKCVSSTDALPGR